MQRAHRLQGPSTHIYSRLHHISESPPKLSGVSKEESWYEQDK